MTESRGALEPSETERETRKLEGLCLSLRKAGSGHEKERWVEIQKLQNIRCRRLRGSKTEPQGTLLTPAGLGPIAEHPIFASL